MCIKLEANLKKNKLNNSIFNSPINSLIKTFTKDIKYTLEDFQSDIFAGIIVALVAMPLGLSLAIAAGVSPEIGLYTIISAGLITAILGGSRFQVTGPTAAFVAILLPIVQTYGYQGLILTTFLAGIMLIGMGYMQFGKLIQFIPYPVTAGFTSGIGLVIMTLQIKDFLGLAIKEVSIGFTERVLSIFHSLSTISPVETSIGVITLGALFLVRKYFKKLPAPIVVLPIISLACFLVVNFNNSFQVSTILNTFSHVDNGVVARGLPQSLPHVLLPWTYLNIVSDGALDILNNLKDLILPAMTIAILAAIESLLSAVVADGITNTKHNPDSELIGLGIGNLIGSFFGSIPATGAIARTATNINFGGKTQIAAIIHSIIVLLTLVFAAPIISYLPMASLAALLLMVSIDMIDIGKLKKIVLSSPKSDAMVLLITLSMTVLFDMVMGVFVGIILAAFLFMKRMSDVTCGCIFQVETSDIDMEVSENIICYKINGPLFFGAADKAIKVINDVMPNVDTVVFIMDAVPSIDLTGLSALENSIRKLEHNNKKLIFVGLQEQPASMMKKAGFWSEHYSIQQFATLKEAVMFAI